MIQNTARREHERASFEGLVALCRDRAEERLSAEDIGPGGVFVRTDEALAVKSLLTLHIALPGRSLGFTALGRVAHVRGGPNAGAGIEFIEIRPSERDRISDYVEGMLQQRAA